MKKYLFALFCIVSILKADCNLAQSSLVRTIVSGESKVKDRNEYDVTIKQIAPKKFDFTDFKAREMTIGQIRDEFSKGTYNLQAIGRMQFIKDTFNEAVRHLGLGDDVLFSEAIQDRFWVEYFFTKKRRAIGNYLYCDTGNVESAAYSASKEWASIGVKKGLPTSSGVSKTEFGDTYYGSGGDKAHTSYAQIRQALESTKAEIQAMGCEKPQGFVCSVDEPPKEADSNTTGGSTEPPEDVYGGEGQVSEQDLTGVPDYKYLQSNNCYCNNKGGISLINDAKIIPTEKMINKIISQMVIDANNQIYFMKEYWTLGLGAEASQFAPQNHMFKHFSVANKEENYELKKKNNLKCLNIDALINKINLQIITAEMSLLEAQKDLN